MNSISSIRQIHHILNLNTDVEGFSSTELHYVQTKSEPISGRNHKNQLILESTPGKK